MRKVGRVKPEVRIESSTEKRLLFQNIFFVTGPVFGEGRGESPHLRQCVGQPQGARLRSSLTADTRPRLQPTRRPDARSDGWPVRQQHQHFQGQHLHHPVLRRYRRLHRRSRVRRPVRVLLLGGHDLRRDLHPHLRRHGAGYRHRRRHRYCRRHHPRHLRRHSGHPPDLRQPRRPVYHTGYRGGAGCSRRHGHRGPAEAEKG